MARYRSRAARATAHLTRGKGASPTQALAAVARFCRTYGSRRHPDDGVLKQQQANCIANELAIANGPARDLISDARIKQAALVNARAIRRQEGRTLSGARARRRRR